MSKAEIGDIIRICRKENGWTQKELAEKVGVPSYMISFWETGREQPRKALYSVFNELFGCDIEVLLGSGLYEKGKN